MRKRAKFFTTLLDCLDREYETECLIEYYVGNIKELDDGQETEILSAIANDNQIVDQLSPRQYEDIIFAFWEAYYDGKIA